MIRRFARPYARAILDISGSAAAAQKLARELAEFEKARQQSPELAELFANPGVDGQSKLSIARKIGERLSLSPLGTKVIELLIQNHRINDLGAVLETLRAMTNRELGIAVAEVRTAHELSEEERRELQASLEKKTGRRIELELRTDPSILGGFVARVGSEIYDASVTGKINRFREHLSGST